MIWMYCNGGEKDGGAVQPNVYNQSRAWSSGGKLKSVGEYTSAVVSSSHSKVGDDSPGELVTGGIAPQVSSTHLLQTWGECLLFSVCTAAATSVHMHYQSKCVQNMTSGCSMVKTCTTTIRSESHLCLCKNEPAIGKTLLTAPVKQLFGSSHMNSSEIQSNPL